MAASDAPWSIETAPYLCSKSGAGRFPSSNASPNATRILGEIINKPPNQFGFTVLPRSRSVERIFAWISRNRRLADDFEATLKSAAPFIYAAPVLQLIQSIARAA